MFIVENADSQTYVFSNNNEILKEKFCNENIDSKTLQETILLLTEVKQFSNKSHNSI